MRYEREDGCRAWLTYAGLQPGAARELLEEHRGAEPLYDRFVRERGAFLRERLTEAQLSRLQRQAGPEAMHRMMARMARFHMGILADTDYAYPDALRSISDAPALLFYIGDVQALNTPRAVTMVGARKVSYEGERATETIARELSEAGVTIVSGLALGVDSAAHRGCIQGGSPTVAALACGLDLIYPAENERLREEILHRGGALIGEYPPGTPGHKGRFPVRNRIMSGMTRATILMEGRLRSGSMTTVHHALDQNREVYAYPGQLNTEWSEAAHQLLREGARYFTCAADILEDMDWLDSPAPSREEKEALPPLSREQQAIMALLRRGSQSMDELAMGTGLDAPALLTALTILQMGGLVKALPGKSYGLA